MSRIRSTAANSDHLHLENSFSKAYVVTWRPIAAEVASQTRRRTVDVATREEVVPLLEKRDSSLYFQSQMYLPTF